MKNLLNKLRVNGLITLFYFFLASTSFAIITNVNSGATYSSLDTAVDSANSGDTLLVSTGQYTYMSINDRNLTIIGGYTPDFSTQISYTDTIIDYNGSYASRFSYSTSVVEALTFTGSKCGINLRSGSLVTARYCYATGNTSDYDGAGIYILIGAKLVLEHSYVRYNSTTNNTGNGKGGGAYVTGTLVISENSRINDNYAEEKGGGVFVQSGGTIEIKDNSFVSANYAKDAGGGIYAKASTVYIHDEGRIGSISGTPNSTLGNGGGIYSDDSTIIIDDGSYAVVNNYAEKSGGGIFLNTNSIASFNNIDIGVAFFACSNWADQCGGAICSLASTLAISNSTIQAANTKGCGGAIYSEDSDIFLYNSTVGNTNDFYTNISDDGGAIYVNSGSAYIENSTFENNHSTDNGGAFFIDDAEIYITNSIIRNSMANGNGGAFCVNSGSAIMNIFDSNIISNYGHNGGAIDWSSYSNLNIYSTYITANRAELNGGGMYLSGSSSILLDNINLLDNRANNDGGGIYAYDTMDIKVIDPKINDNIADNDFNGSGDGGGIFADDGTKLQISISNNNSEINYNKAVNGAGIYIAGSSSIMNINAPSNYRLDVRNNNAGSYGGGLFVYSSADTYINGNVRINNCRADLGGGVYIRNAGFSMTKIHDYKPQIRSCLANKLGAGIYAKNFFNNIVCDGVIFGEPGNSITQINPGNGGGAVALFDGAKLYATNCVFNGNSSPVDGGAVLVSNATVMISGSFSDGGSGKLPPSIFVDNSAYGAGSRGGAIYAVGGSLVQIFNTAIVSNDSSNGGALFAIGNSNVKFVNTLIAENDATNILGGGSAVTLFNSRGKMNFCTVVNNFRSGVEAIGAGSSLDMTNCIVWGHSQINVSTNSIQNVIYSNVQGGYPGIGNINQNPLFADEATLDYELTAGSPCKNLAVDIGITNDCIGVARPQLGGYDMGCYEFVPEGGMVFSILCSVFGIFIYRRKFISSFQKN